MRFISDLCNFIGFLILLDSRNLFVKWYWDVCMVGAHKKEKDWNKLDNWVFYWINRPDKHGRWFVHRLPIGTLFLFIGLLLSLALEYSCAF